MSLTAHRGAGGVMESATMKLGALLEELPEELARQVFTHASWSERRSDSYTRLAFLGDSVLALSVTAHLYPRLEAEHFGAGRLTKIRAQAVSGPSCRVVAEELGVVEPFWQAQLAVFFALLLHLALPGKLTLGPRWLLPLFEGMLLAGLVISTPYRHHSQSPARRRISIALIALSVSSSR